MTLTLEQILQFDVLRRAEPEVLAGRAHLDRPVRWVHISEQLDIARFLKGGELLLMTGIGLGSEPTVHRRFIAELAEVGVTGVLIRLGAAFDRLPADLIEEAERRDLPLLALHRRIGWVEVTEQVHGAIITRQLDLLRKAEQTRREFTDLVLRGAGLSHILRRLAGIVQCPVVLEDTAHQVIAFEPSAIPPADLLASWEHHSRLGHEQSGEDVHLERGDPSCAWIAIWLRGEKWGSVHALQIGRQLDEIDLLALDRAAAAVGLALLTEHNARLAGDAARSALISDIQNGRYGSSDEFIRRARSLGVELDGRRLAVLILEPRGLAEVAEAQQLLERERQEIRTRLLEHVRGSVKEGGSVSLSALDGDRVIVVVGCSPAAPIRKVLTDAGSGICRRIAAQWAGRIVPSIGASDETTPSALRPALEQATEAATFGARVSKEPGVHHFADLGVYRLLLPLGDGPQLASYVEAELGPLLQHDARAGVPLLSTLSAYLEHAGRISQTAAVLHLQRRTLYHRLTRIAALLGRDLGHGEVRLRLWVAVRGLDLIRRKTGTRT